MAHLSGHGPVLIGIATGLAPHPPDDAEAAVTVMAHATAQQLRTAVADSLADVGLPTVWAATGPRPLRAALDALDPSAAGLLNAGTLADAGPVSPNLRALADLDPVEAAASWRTRSAPSARPSVRCCAPQIHASTRRSPRARVPVRSAPRSWR